MDLKVGDKGWFVAGYRSTALVAIECTIVEVDDTFRRLDPGAYLFYWLDEPVGHGVYADELLTREEAEQELFERYEQVLEYESSENALENAQLEDHRKDTVKFIVETHNLGSKESERAVERMLELYPHKEHGKQWFNVADVKRKR